MSCFTETSIFELAASVCATTISPHAASLRRCSSFRVIAGTPNSVARRRVSLSSPAAAAWFTRSIAASILGLAAARALGESRDERCLMVWFTAFGSVAGAVTVALLVALLVVLPVALLVAFPVVVTVPVDADVVARPEVVS